MAHEIEEIDGVAQMAYVGDIPWHGLGTRLEEGVSPQEMMVAAGLDWEVKSYPTYVSTDDGHLVETGQNALLRETDHAVLTHTGPGWNPVQNSEAFEFFDKFTEAGNGKMKMHTAGSLKDGQIVWALAKVDESFEIFGEDMIDSYLLFTNPHTYGKVIDIRFTPVRVVCNNTLMASLKGASKGEMKINHRKPFSVDTVMETMGLAKNLMDDYKEVALFLGSKRADEESLKDYYKAVFGANKDDDLTRTGKLAMDVFERQPGHEFAEGSWWQAYNSVTYMADHLLGREADTRLQSSWYGANRKKKLDSMTLALEMAA